MDSHTAPAQRKGILKIAGGKMSGKDLDEEAIEIKIVNKLKEKGWQVTSAESCTGGMIASRLVNVAGVSDIFMEGYITYSNEAQEKLLGVSHSNSAKHKLLGVSKEALDTWGAVSRQVAEQMARGAAEQAGAQAAIAVTGIAGPDGGTPKKPVGLVYIGCFAGGETVVTENHFKGSRLEIRQKTAQTALELLFTCISR